MKADKKRILDYFRKSESKAAKILNNKSKASETLKDALGKAVNNRSDLDGIWAKMLLLFAVSKDYISGNYTEIPKRSIVAILGGLIYFLSPIDVIPDFIPFMGFFDDIFVLNLVYKQVIKDLEAYKVWKEQQQQIISIDESPAR